MVNSSHEWDHLYINLGLGNNVSNWNISLTPQAFNKSGTGALCLPTVRLPAGLVQDGQNASIQFVMGGGSGNALYNVSSPRRNFAWCQKQKSHSREDKRQTLF
jgi:hypothetical protein